MRFSVIAAVLKKEITEVLRDKKTLITGILLPILLYPVLIIVMTQVMALVVTDIAQKDILLGISAPPPKPLADLLSNQSDDAEDAGQIRLIETSDFRKDLKNEKIQLYLEIDETGDKPKFTLYYNTSDTALTYGAERIESVLEDYRESLTEIALTEQGMVPEQILSPILIDTVSTAEKEEMAGSFLGMILPLLLIVGVVMGAIYPAMESIAGEKERGTLETLFVLPVSNLELVTGKFLAVAISAFVATLANVISIGLSMVYLISSGGGAGIFDMAGFRWSQMILPVIITFLCLCLFAVIVSAGSMCVCALAKTYKDAQAYISPFMLVFMLPAYATMIPTIKLSGATAAIPVVNVALLIKSVFQFDVNMSLLMIVLISNMAYSTLLVLLLSRMFSSEEILFGSNRRFMLLEKRSDIQAGQLPSKGEGALMYGVGMLLIIYGSALIAVFFGTGLLSTALVQLIILGLPILFLWYGKANWRQVIPIKGFSFPHFLGGFLLMLAALSANLIFQQVLMKAFPNLQKISEQVSQAITNDSFLLTLLVAAVMPALGEEIFFRGYLFTSFSHKKRILGSVVATSVLFGLFHMNVPQMVTGLLLGLVLAYSRWKSGSILLPMLLHFCNNALAVSLSELPSEHWLSKGVSSVFTMDHPVKTTVVIIIAVAAAVVGWSLLRFEAISFFRKDSPRQPSLPEEVSIGEDSPDK